MDLGGYEVIALGTAMYMGMPLKALSRFCAVHETSLFQADPVHLRNQHGAGRQTVFMAAASRFITNADPITPSSPGGEIRKGKGIPMANMILKEYAKTHASHAREIRWRRWKKRLLPVRSARGISRNSAVNKPKMF